MKARQSFERAYEEKTGNKFGAKKFTKRPNKFYHLDVDLGVPKTLANTTFQSKLSEPVQQLMKMLFDTKQMENEMIVYDLDLSKMPLGKISAKQIRQAMTVLQTIMGLIYSNGTIHQLREASNEFYTLIPHSFGVKRPPIIDSIDVVNAKNEMLDSLLNMELIYGFLTEENEIETHPLDACYHKLKTTITPIAKDSEEFAQLFHMLRDSHGPTHNTFVLDAIEIFKVNREEDEIRFRQVENLPNHQLLWHGSRLTNFVSILRNGLKIAPPEGKPNSFQWQLNELHCKILNLYQNECNECIDTIFNPITFLLSFSTAHWIYVWQRDLFC